MKICQVQSSSGVKSETFLAAQAHHLPAASLLLTGNGIQMSRSANESELFPPTSMSRPWREFVARSRTEDLVVRLFLRRCDASVVLAQYGTNGVLVQDAARRLGLPLVVHFHGFDAWSTPVLKRYADEYQRMLGDAKAIIAVSSEMVEQVCRLGAARDRVQLIPCGVDPGRFSVAHPGETGPNFLAVGRFVEKKAPHLTLLAFAEARKLAPEITLRMIGDGPLLASCKTLASALGIEDSVTFLGAQEHEVGENELLSARALVQHSTRAPSGDREGTPVSILEAAMCGVPVISTLHAGIPAAVTNGVTGLLTAERDIEGMAQSIRLLAVEPDLATNLGRAARADAIERHSLEQSIGRLRQVLLDASKS